MRSTDTQAPGLPRPQGAIEALHDLRQRLRRLFLLDGLVALGIAVSVAVVATFVVDYFLGLPAAVRVVVLLGALAYVLSVVYRRLLRPARLAPGEEDLAVLVEKEHPELRQSLVTALQLTSGRASTRFLSSQLIGKVVSEVEAALPSIAFRRVIRLGALRRSALVLVALLGALLYGAWSQPELAGIWFRRFFLLSIERWPKSVELELVSPPPGPVVLALGDDLPVEVVVRRGDPVEVEITYWTGRRNRRTELLRPTADSRFRKLFDNVSEPFSFRVRGGDDELPTVSVEVQLRPKISHLALWFEYPAYTGKEPTPADTPIRSGHMRVPEGTVIRYRAISDVPVQRAFFQFIESEELRRRVGAAESSGRDPFAVSKPPADAVELDVVVPTDRPEFVGVFADQGASAVSPLEGSGFSGEFTVTGDGVYLFYLEGENGLWNQRPVRFRVRMVKDREPVVRVREPARAKEEISVEAVVSLEILVRDDYGIRDGGVEGFLFRGDSEEGKPVRIALEELTAATPEVAVEERSVERTLEISSLDARVGDRFQFYAAATDFGGNQGESDRYVFQIVNKEDIERLLQSQLMVLREQIQAVQRQQESARKDLESFQKEALLKEAIDPREASKLTRFRQDQARVTRGLERSVREVDRILAKMESNRVGDEKQERWIQGIRENLAGLGEVRSPRIEEGIQTLRQDATSSPQDPSRLSDIIDRQRELGRDLNDLAMRLTEFGDINAVIQQWRDILRREQEIRARLHQQVLEASGSQ